MFFQAKFQKLALDLLESKEVEDPAESMRLHKQKVDELRRLFPKAKRWIDWWQSADVAAMLFPACKPELDEEDIIQDDLPNTTNVQESLHRVIYMIR